jgi:uncharacterized protein (TIGR02145 family)
MKTNLSRLPQFIIIAAITFLSITNTNLYSQVTIGSDIAPSRVTLLELKSQQAGTVATVTDVNNVTSTIGGLLLPRVQLENTATLEPFISTSDPDWTGSDATSFKLNLAGLLVYNITSNGTLEPGIYIWTGIQWATYTTTVPPSSITGQPKAFTFYEKGTETPAPLKFHVDGPGSWTYKWYRIISRNVHVPAGKEITAENSGENGYGTGYNTSDFTPKVCIGTTRDADYCNLYRYYCIAESTSGVKFTSDIAEVAVGCGAKNNLGDWLSFMCFNLGAERDISIQQQMERPLVFYNDSAGPHAYNIEEDSIYGSLFQWGRIADGHQLRSSTNMPSAGMLSASIGDGKTCGTTGISYPYRQVKDTSVWYGRFITGSPWTPIAQNQFDQLWRANRFRPNDPCAHYRSDGTYSEFWNALEGSTTTDACRETNTAWRLPAQSEWGEIYRGGLLSGAPDAATANSWEYLYATDENDQVGKYKYKIAGGHRVKPDNVTVTLFLPATGYRNSSDGMLYTPGTNGYYWSFSIATNTAAYSLRFSGGNVLVDNTNSRTYGAAIRCIKNI